MNYRSGAPGPGDLTATPAGTFKYDAENRMVSSTTLLDTRYIYDAEGRRVKKVAGADVTVYVYDGMGQLAAEYGGTVPATARAYLTADHLGSTRVVTNHDGAEVLRRSDYLPFGEEIPVPGGSWRSGVSGYATQTASTNILFTGQLRDGETGLDYFGARYFSGAQGRLTSPDQPLIDQNPLDPQSWNLYAYARNNPLRYIDPTGREICSYDEGKTPEGGAATTEKACTDSGGRWVYQPTDTDDPYADAEAFQFSVTKTENTRELSAGGQEFFQGNAQLWNDTAGAVNTAAVATGAVLTLPVVVPAATNAVGYLGFGTTVVAGGQASTQVSRWGRAGLDAGDWVMKGAASRWNYFWSGKWEPSWVGGPSVTRPTYLHRFLLVRRSRSLPRPFGGRAGWALTESGKVSSARGFTGLSLWIRFA